jgi:hypothetical protein
VNKNLSFQTHALLDIGCSTNLISRDLVEEMDLPTVPLRQILPITLADGQLAATPISQAVEPLSLEIQTHSELLCPLVADIAHPLILGIPWFRRHNPKIDWRTQMLVLNGCPPICDADAHPISLVSSDLLMTHHSHKALVTSEKTLLNIPESYLEYSEVFKPTCDIKLPPLRELALKIDFSPDAKLPTVNQIYRLTQPEENELRSWINDQLERGLIVPSKSTGWVPNFLC